METTGALLTLAGEVQTSLAGPKQNLRVHEQVVTALRRIYFTPSRSLAILAMLAEGERPPAEMYEAILLDFNDAEWDVMRSLRYIEQLDGERAVSLRASRILEQIAYGKRNLRGYIQDLVNEALTFGTEINPEEARAALMCVKSLNTAIESIEAAYNWQVGRI